MSKPRLLVVTLTLVLAGCSSAGWTDGGYLYRSTFWGIPHLISSSDDYKLFPAHQIGTASPPFEFANGPDNRPWETYAEWSDIGGYYKYF